MIVVGLAAGLIGIAVAARIMNTERGSNFMISDHWLNRLIDRLLGL